MKQMRQSQQRKRDHLSQVQVRIPRDLWRAAKHQATDRDMPLGTVLASALHQGLSQLLRCRVDGARHSSGLGQSPVSRELTRR